MLAPALERSLQVLRRAFPEGVPQDDYFPLLAALFDEFSEENLGIVLAELLDGERVVIINDSIKAAFKQRPPEADIERIRERLTNAGWEWEYPDGF